MYKVQSSKVLLKDVRLFAYHGVLPQERTVGAWFVLNVTLDVDFSSAMEMDELNGTVSYAEVYEVIKARMAVPSRLVEHVAGRITKALFQAFPAITRIQLELIKENPPMGAESAGAGVSIEAVRGGR